MLFGLDRFNKFNLCRKPSAKKAAEQAALQLQRPVFECSFKDMMDIIENCRKVDYARFPRMMSEGLSEPVETRNSTELWSFWKGILPGRYSLEWASFNRLIQVQNGVD